LVQFWANCDDDDTVYAPSFSDSTKSSQKGLFEHCVADTAPAAPGKLRKTDAAEDIVTSAGIAREVVDSIEARALLLLLLLGSSWQA
jgi:hypothetical protein